MTVILWLLQIALRLALLIGVFIGLFFSIRKLIESKNQVEKGCKYIIVTVFLCLCLLLGVVEPTLKPRIKKDTVVDAYCYLLENSSYYEPLSFKTDKIKGVCYFYNNNFLSEYINRENVFISAREDYFYYDDIEYLTIYYQPTKCKRWEGGYHFPIDFLGVPNSLSPSRIYISGPSGVAFISFEYIEDNPIHTLNPVISTYYFYRPQVDFNEIVSSIDAINQE